MSKYKYWDDDQEAVLRKYAGIKTAEEISVILGRSKHSIWSRAAKLEISLQRHGENHQGSKLSNLQVEMLHALVDAGFGTAEIHQACLPHVTVAHIYEIKQLFKRVNG